MKLFGDKLAKLVKDGKVSQQFADRIGNPDSLENFATFVAKISAGNGQVTKEELQSFLPKELQEAMAKNLVADFQAKGAETDPARIALLMELGKVPGEKLTAGELANGAQYMVAAQKLYKLAEARLTLAGDQFDWSASGSDLAVRMAQAAMVEARVENTTGQCAHGFHEAFRRPLALICRDKGMLSTTSECWIKCHS